MKYFSIRGFDKLQHYKDRNPPWTKFYFSLIRDYEFGQLQSASKLQLILLMALASQHNNKLPRNPKWLRNQIQVEEEIDFQSLDKYWLIDVDEDMLADCDKNPILYKEEVYKEEKNKKKTIKKEKVFEPDDPFRVTAGKLFKFIQVHLPDAKKPNPNKWADTVRLMVEVDKKTLSAIEELFEWASKDDFWRSNILSPAKLRGKWDQLESRMLSEKGRNGNEKGVVI